MTSELLSSATYKDGKTDGNIAYIMVENQALRGDAVDDVYAIDFLYQESETKVTEAIQEITNEKAPDAPEEVKTGDNTMLFVPVIIGILAVIGIIVLIIQIRRSKR